MKLIKQPNAWSCVGCAFAMATDTTLERFIIALGHDGSERWWPEIPEPYGCRCFDVQECSIIAFNSGYFVHEIRNGYEYGPEDHAKRKITLPDGYLDTIMNQHQGVLLVTPKYAEQNSHAVAWDGKQVYDPLGFMAGKEQYNIESFLIIGRR